MHEEQCSFGRRLLAGWKETILSKRPLSGLLSPGKEFRQMMDSTGKIDAGTAVFLCDPVPFFSIPPTVFGLSLSRP
jgi:hypothetical protein